MSDKNSARTKHGGKSKKPTVRKLCQSIQSLQQLKLSPVQVALQKANIPKRNLNSKPAIPEYLRSVTKKEGDTFRYALDTNTIMHNPDVIFKFDEHEVGIPGACMEECDKHKNNMDSDAGLNIRTMIRHLVTLVEGKTPEEIQAGLVLDPPDHLKNGKPHTGKIFWDYSEPDISLCEGLKVDLDISIPDHRILLSCLKWKKEGKKVVLITSDKILRILAANVGIAAEEYFGDVIEYLPSCESDVITGFHNMDEDFWAKIGDKFKIKKIGTGDWYELTHSMFKDMIMNQFIIIPGRVDSESETIMKIVGKPSPYKIEAETIFFNKYKKIVTPKNIGQGLAFELLMDPDIPCVAINGATGSGKTHLALVAGMEGIDAGDYDRIVITRSLADLDKDIGFLPGTEAEKTSPWHGGPTNILRSLFSSNDTDLSRGENEDRRKDSVEIGMERYRIEFRSLNHMRGESLERTYLIHDESQNTTLSQMKTITTRAGEGSKIIHLGNAAQIDSKNVSVHTNGLSAFIRRSIETQTPLVGAVTLEGVVRSPLAEWAEQNL